MPAYMSHAVMIDNLYNESKNDNKLFKVLLDVEELRTYSLGADLASLSKYLTKDPHSYDTRAFFIKMVEHIKKRDLIENKHALACLYGHISHYFMDICMHPFIYSIEKGCKEVGSISAHHLIEGYISTYLVHKILEKDIMEVNENYFNKADLNVISVRDMLDDLYGELYGDYNIIKTYKATLQLFANIERIAKSGLFSEDFLIHFSRFNIFLKQNNLTKDDLNNYENKDYIHPVSGEIKNSSVLEMYYLSILMTKHAIEEVNKVLYDGKSIIKLESVFKDLSYNTGLPCCEEQKMCYIKKR